MLGRSTRRKSHSPMSHTRLITVSCWECRRILKIMCQWGRLIFFFFSMSHKHFTFRVLLISLILIDGMFFWSQSSLAHGTGILCWLSLFVLRRLKKIYHHFQTWKALFCGTENVLLFYLFSWVHWSLDSIVLQNNLFCVPEKKKETHAGFKPSQKHFKFFTVLIWI